MSKRVASGEGPMRFRPKNWYRKIYKDCQITTYSRQRDTALFEARYSVSSTSGNSALRRFPFASPALIAQRSRRMQRHISPQFHM